MDGCGKGGDSARHSGAIVGQHIQTTVVRQYIQTRASPVSSLAMRASRGCPAEHIPNLGPCPVHLPCVRSFKQESRHRTAVLRKLGHVAPDGTVLLKGRAACEIDTAGGHAALCCAAPCCTALQGAGLSRVSAPAARFPLPTWQPIPTHPYYHSASPATVGSGQAVVAQLWLVVHSSLALAARLHASLLIAAPPPASTSPGRRAADNRAHV